VLCFYLISALTTFIIGTIGLSKLYNSNSNQDTHGSDRHKDHDQQQNQDGISETYTQPRVSFNVFTYTLPFVAFVLDHSTKRLKNLSEKSVYILVKLMLIIYYLGTYVLALQTLSSITYYIVCNANLVIFPPLTLLYGYLLRRNVLG